MGFLTSGARTSCPLCSILAGLASIQVSGVQVWGVPQLPHDPAGMCEVGMNTVVGASVNGLAVAPLGILIALIPAAIGALLLYWIIRLAVRHGIRDSRR